MNYLHLTLSVLGSFARAPGVPAKAESAPGIRFFVNMGG